MMRSFIASLILFFSLIGIFAPVSISVTSNISPQNKSNSQTTNAISKISIGVSSVFAQAEEEEKSYTGTAGVCGWKDFACAITNVIVDILLFIPNMIAMVTGVLTDFLLSISINPGTYGVPGSTLETNIQSLWQITRDLANIGFIFALFVAAFGLIVGRDIESFSPKKTVIRVIIMALLVNFSMFFCRIIIQTADIFSHVIANQISAGTLKSEDKFAAGALTLETNGVIVSALIKQGIKPISLKILQTVQPQQLFSKASGKIGTGNNAAKLATAGVIFFVLIALISIFVHMGFIFLGRIVGLWLGIIMSPLAFVSFAIPFLEKNQYIGFENWLKSFAKLAFLTPLYLFFVYIAVSLLDTNFTGIFSSSLEGSNWVVSLLATVISVLLPLAIALFVIFQGKKYATEMAGVIGEMVGKVSGVVSSFAMGAATGGTGMLARQTLGRAGAAIGNSRGLTDAASKGGFSGMLARNAMKMGDKTSAMSFDVRNSKKAMDLFGRGTAAMGEKIDMGTKFKNEGGYETEGGIEKMPGKYMDGVAKKAEEREKANNEYVQGKLKKQQEEDQRATRENLAISQADVERETNKIKTGAENSIVGADAEQAQLNLTGNNQAIAGIDDKLKENKDNTAIADAEIVGKDTDIADIDAKIKEKEELMKGANGNAPARAKAAQAAQEKAQLEQQKQQLTQQKALVLQKKQDLQTESADLETQKADIEKESEELLKEVELIALGAAGKTAKEVQVLADKLKLDAADSDSKKDLDKFDVDLSTERAESARLNKLMKVAIDSKNGQEQTRLAGLISTQTNKLNQVAAQQKAAKDNYDREFGKNIKILEDSAKNTMKKFTDSNRTELDRLKKVSTGFQKDLMDIELAGEMRMQASMESLAQSHEGKADRGGITKFVSTATGIVTGGAVGGTNIKNNKAARGSADDARGRSK